MVLSEAGFLKILPLVFFPLKKCRWIFAIFKLEEPTFSGRRQCPEVKVPRHLGQPSHLGADFVLIILSSPVKRKFYLYVFRNFEPFSTIIVLLPGRRASTVINSVPFCRLRNIRRLLHTGTSNCSPSLTQKVFRQGIVFPFQHSIANCLFSRACFSRQSGP